MLYEVITGQKVGWLDGDIGQATLGVPGSVGLALLDAAGEERPRAEKSFFVGAVSPRGHMLPLLVGLRRLRDHALAAGAVTVLVDTTGLVAAEAGGGALKEWNHGRRLRSVITSYSIHYTKLYEPVLP